ncbi:hypothetical protein F4809DRAFT_622125 [Biscogniauxia mediterranea]|nr:hypothetical protein F4809DRAFT_622125 [Biscogniauxia mediterranea]
MILRHSSLRALALVWSGLDWVGDSTPHPAHDSCLTCIIDITLYCIALAFYKGMDFTLEDARLIVSSRKTSRDLVRRLT